jgi:hypothetical protein
MITGEQQDQEQKQQLLVPHQDNIPTTAARQA